MNHSLVLPWCGTEGTQTEDEVLVFWAFLFVYLVFFSNDVAFKASLYNYEHIQGRLFFFWSTGLGSFMDYY